MNPRALATPVTIGSFILIAVTGILMFFHLNTGLNKPAHEWLSWALLAGVGLHAWVNWDTFKRYFQKRQALVLMGIFLAVLGLSFLPLNKGGGRQGFNRATDALLDAPITLLAQVAGKDPQAVVSQLDQAGIAVTMEQSLRQGAVNREQQMQALGLVFDK